MADFAPRSMKRKNVKGLALTPAAPKPPPTAETANNDESANLEIGIEYNLDLRPEDIEFIKELGSGNGGTVSKVRHIPTNTTIARKVSSTLDTITILCSETARQCPSDRHNVTTGYPRRSKAGNAQADCSRAANYAWLPLRIHRDLLRLFSQ